MIEFFISGFVATTVAMLFFGAGFFVLTKIGLIKFDVTPVKKLSAIISTQTAAISEASGNDIEVYSVQTFDQMHEDVVTEVDVLQLAKIFVVSGNHSIDANAFCEAVPNVSVLQYLSASIIRADNASQSFRMMAA